MIKPTQLIFLPGAGGSPAFWQPVAQRLGSPGKIRLLGWPGCAGIPADPSITGLQDLVTLVVKQIDQPTALIAQSMGGVVAVQAALAVPHLVTHLVLAATSGGVNMAEHQTVDWREEFFRENPIYPRWFGDYQEDLSDRIPKIHQPTLLLWGDSDGISPVSVGRRLLALLPNAEMHIVPGGDHGFANQAADMISPLIQRHLQV
jgi:pimeloyl-ACP methyl ester carboxylesterase